MSPTSITVQAADKKSETFVVGKDTKVASAPSRRRAAPAEAKGSARRRRSSKVAKGDHVLVVGTGTTTLTAKHIVDIKGTK